MPEPSAEPALSGVRLNLRIVSVVIFNFASYLTIGLPLAILPGYVHDVMGFSAFWAGLVISLQYFATLISRPHAGRYADLFGPKSIVVVGLCGCFLSGLGYFLAATASQWPLVSLVLLCLGRVILGIGQSLAGTGSTLWGVGVVGASHIGRVISWNGIVTYGAMAIGAPLGVVCYAWGGLYGLSLTIMAVALLAILLALPRPVRVRALQQAAGRELSRRHLLALERLCDGEGLGHADVPGLRVTREQGRLFFGAQALPPLGTHILRPGETVEIPELGLRVTVGVPEPFREIHSAFTTFCFKSAIIHDKLSVTPRRPGDRIRLAGRGCTKRVSDLFAERGLTQAERDRVPIIRAADAPAAIAGFGVAEQCAAAPGQTMICIRMEQIQTYGGEYYERYER